MSLTSATSPAVRSLAAALLLLWFAGLPPVGYATGGKTVFIAIIIDDLGENLERGRAAIALPGPVAVAIMPQLPHSTRLAQSAHEQYKEVLLHLPLEPVVRKDLMGPGSLERTASSQTISQSLAASLQSVPGAIGISNHMGSLYTQDPEAMGRLMQAMKLQAPGLFFLDSLTTPNSAGREQAENHGINLVTRHVFLDHVRDHAAIEKQFQRLISQAQRRGHAVAIAHPYPETLAFLAERLPAYQTGAVRLVPVSYIIALKMRIAQEQL